MSEPKHTPGPWYHTQNYGQVGQVEDAHGNVVAQAQMMRPLDIEVRNANARLIAAAPDFLAACKAAIAATEHINAFATDKRMTAALELMRAAIRKAEGEPARV